MIRATFGVLILIILALLNAVALQSQQTDVRVQNKPPLTPGTLFKEADTSSTTSDTPHQPQSTPESIENTEVENTSTSTQSQKNTTQKTPDTSKGASIAIVTTPPPRYSFDQKTTEELNASARAALVNILCRTSGSTVPPISGSGIIIDPRGIILTNAHVAQYLLLSTRPEVDLSCVVRTDSPAKDRWSAEILYIPPVWIQEHAKDIANTRPTSTGEHDFALLRIINSVTAEPLPDTFPYLPVETRDLAIQEDDVVVLAAYPAEFSLGSVARGILNAVSTVTNIQQLLTFREQTVDVVSLGGIALAQSGSSGGAVINAWGYLVGLISTTSEGETTAERDLRAITGSYINRALIQETGSGLSLLPSQDIAYKSAEFNRTYVPALTQELINQLTQ